MGNTRHVAVDENDFMAILRDMAKLHARLEAAGLTAGLCGMGDEDESIALLGIFRGDELVLWEPEDGELVIAARALMDRWDLGEQAKIAGYRVAVIADHQGRAERVELELEGTDIDDEAVTDGDTNAAIRRMLDRHHVLAPRTATTVIGEA